MLSFAEELIEQQQRACLPQELLAVDKESETAHISCGAWWSQRLDIMQWSTTDECWMCVASFRKVIWTTMELVSAAFCSTEHGSIFRSHGVKSDLWLLPLSLWVNYDYNVSQN